MQPSDLVLAPNSELLVLWEDGHPSVYPPVFLRRSCPCATCRDVREKEAKRPKGMLAMAKGPSLDEVEAVSIAPVGNYAIAIRWKDGHDTGIYSYKLLRALCPCDGCRGGGVGAGAG